MDLVRGPRSHLCRSDQKRRVGLGGPPREWDVVQNRSDGGRDRGTLLWGKKWSFEEGERSVKQSRRRTCLYGD